MWREVTYSSHEEHGGGVFVEGEFEELFGLVGLSGGEGAGGDL